MKIRITFKEEVLGTTAGEKEVFQKFIASKGPNAKTTEEEIEAYGEEEVVNKGMTLFPKLESGNPFFWDYQIKGFFKDSCSALKRCPDFKSSELKAHNKIIDGCIFVSPRKIEITLAGEMGVCERPLRAQTAKGERISLACSQTIPAGSAIEFEVRCLNNGHEKFVREWLGYGEFRGMGAWRNSGKGSFSFEEI